MLAKSVSLRRAPDGAVEIPILGGIGDETRADDIIRQLMMFRPKEVKFVIYSPGGSAFDAIALIGYLNANGIASFTEIYGMCASAATILAAHSGPKRTAMAPGSQFMIHNGSGFIRKLVDDVNDFAVGLYRDAYGWDKKSIKAFMEANDGNGTFWNAEEAKKAGISSEVMEDARVAAHYQKNDQPIAMSETKVKVKGKLLNTIAVVGNEVEIEVEATEEQTALKEVADQATADRIAAEAKVKEAQDEVEAAKAREEEATKKLAETEAARAAAVEAAAKSSEEAKVNADELVKAKAVIEKLSKLPTASAVIASMGGEVQEPGTPTEPIKQGDGINEEIARMKSLQERIAAKKSN